MSEPRTAGLAHRIYILFLLAAVIPVAIAGVIGVHFSLDALKRETIRNLQQEVTIRAQGIERFLEQLASQLRYLAGSPLLLQYAESLAGGDQDEIHRVVRKMEQEFLAFAESYPHAYQLRLLSALGREVARVNHTENGAVVVPEQELQDKSDRYYFSDAWMFPPGSIYVSPLDLNEEFGAIEEPHRPVLRLATRLDGPSSTSSPGLLIINLHADVLLEQMQQMADVRGGMALLFDGDGHFLARDGSRNDAATVFAMKTVDRLADALGSGFADLAAEPEHLRGRHHGWLVETASIGPVAGGTAPQSGQRWVIAVAYPEREIFKSVFNLHVLYGVLLISLVMTAVGGFHLSRRVLGPMDALTRESEGIGEGDFSRRVLIQGNDEIATLGRRFNWMAERLHQMYGVLQKQRDDLEAEVLERTRDLEAERTFLTTFVQHVGDGILAVGQDGRLRLVNPKAKRCLGLPADVVGQPVSQYWPQWPELEQQSRAAAGVQRHDFALGSRQLSASVTQYEGGAAVVLRDVTEERKLADERRELDRQLFQMEKLVSFGELAMGVAHEIGNPLAGMKAIAQSLQYEQDLVAEVRTALRRFESEIDRLTGFLYSLRSFAVTPVAEFSSCSLSEAVDDVLFWVRKEAKAMGVVIRTENLAETSPVCADGRLLRQLLLNLVINALHAMPEGGTLTIGSTDSKPGWVRIEVVDTGCGIPQELLGTIFEPFFTTRAMGTGLGLPIVRKIAKDHGASVSVRSVVNEGSRFTLDWPEARGAACTKAS